MKPKANSQLKLKKLPRKPNPNKSDFLIKTALMLNKLALKQFFCVINFLEGIQYCKNIYNFTYIIHIQPLNK
jgi:hypothetical protein